MISENPGGLLTSGPLLLGHVNHPQAWTTCLPLHVGHLLTTIKVLNTRHPPAAHIKNGLGHLDPLLVSGSEKRGLPSRPTS